MRRAVSVGTIAVVLVLAAAAYAGFMTCDGGRCEGTDRSDTIRGTRGPDAIFGLGGSDHVAALAGHDFVQGAEGRDGASGGPGTDTLRGNRGEDFIDGGPGDDNIYGDGNPGQGAGHRPAELLVDRRGNDADAIYGGAGFEWVQIEDGDGRDYVNCGADGGRVAFSDRGDEIENCVIAGQ